MTRWRRKVVALTTIDLTKKIISLQWFRRTTTSWKLYQTIKELNQFRRYLAILGEEKNVTLLQPMCVCDYNKYMGGVDKMDWMVSKYRIKIESKKWYFTMFTNLIDMAVVNAHVLYEMVNGKISLLEFRRILTRTDLSTSSISDPKLCGRPHFRQLPTKHAPNNIRKSHVGKGEKAKIRFFLSFLILLIFLTFLMLLIFS